MYRFEKRDKELSNDSISLIFVLCSRFRTLGPEDDWVVGSRLHARANHAVDLSVQQGCLTEQGWLLMATRLVRFVTLETDHEEVHYELASFSPV